MANLSSLIAPSGVVSANDVQDAADWEAGTSTTESIVSPAKVKSAIDANLPAPVSPGLELIAQADVAGEQIFDFTQFDETKYIGYSFYFSGFRPGSNSSVGIKFSGDGGATFISDTSYSFDHQIFGGRYTEKSNNDRCEIRFDGSSTNSGELTLLGPEYNTETVGHFQTKSDRIGSIVGGICRNFSSVVNAIRFFSIGGRNFQGGTITMYGYVK